MIKKRKLDGILENKSKEEQSFFDSLIKKTGETYYGNLRPVAVVRFNRKAAVIKSYINNIKNPNILEIGCGTGPLIDSLVKLQPGLNITGVDISSEAIKMARKKVKGKNIKFIAQNALTLPFTDESFDVIICNSSLHHLPLQLALEEIKRVLKVGGKIWFCEPNYLNPQIILEKNIGYLKKLMGDSKDEQAFFPFQLAKELRKNGFSDVSVNPYEFLHPLIPSFGFNKWVKFCIALESVSIIKYLSGTLIATGVKK